MNGGRTSFDRDVSRPADRRSGMKDVWMFFWKFARKRLGLGMLVVLFGAAAEILQSIVTPLWYKKFIDAVTHVATLPDPSSALVMILAMTIGIRALGVLSKNINFRLNTMFQPGIMHEMMAEAMEKMLGLSHRFYTDNFTGSLIRKIGRIGGSYESLMDIFMTDLFGIVLSLGGILMVVGPRFPLIAIAMSIWVVLTIIAKGLYMRFRLPYFAEFSRLDAASIGIMSDVFSNASTVQAFGQTRKEVRDFVAADTRATHQLVKNWIAHANIDAVSLVLDVLLEAAVLGSMISFLVAGTATIGDIVLIQSFLLVVFGKLNHIARLMRRLTEQTTQIEEVLDLIGQTPEVQDMSRAKAIDVTQGKIEFANVGFAYHGDSVFRRLNLILAPRERVGLVGPSGAGKTTLTKLLLRFYDTTEGEIRIDGQPIASVTQESLRKSIAYVPQDPVLFHRSLFENIAYGKTNASKQEVIAAAKKARCHEFISALPNGYDSLVGERGVKLSGGERQRVAIARAILKNAPILVLDEATSSLDSESEGLIQEALRELMKDKTVLVIAHRLSTIMQMDRIVVMEKGRVVDSGSHAELLKKVGMYQKLWNIQAGSFQTT